MTQKWDHFHAVYQVGEVETHLEGGLSPRDDQEIADMAKALDTNFITPEVYSEWIDQFQRACCKAWGMPEDGVVKSFRLGG